MKKYFYVLLILICNNSSAQKLTEMADSLRDEGKLKEAIDLYKKISDDTIAAYYKLSKAFSLVHEVDSAYKYLSLSLKNDSTILVLNEPDFISIIDDKRWEDIEKRQIAKTELKYGKYKNLELARTLWRLKMKDQAYYYHIKIAEDKLGVYSAVALALWDIKNILNKDNSAKIEEIINERGWPKFSEVKGSAAQTAFFIIQHSELKKQKVYIEKLQNACKQNEANWADYALMYDRIQIGEGKKQLYGSQLRFSKTSNKYELFPIEDEQNLNKRRKDIGLEKMSEYVKQWGLKYDVPQNE